MTHPFVNNSRLLSRSFHLNDSQNDGPLRMDSLVSAGSRNNRCVAYLTTSSILSFVVVYRGLVKAESGSDTVLNGFQLMVFHMTDAVRESGFIDVCHLIAHSN